MTSSCTWELPPNIDPLSRGPLFLLVKLMGQAKPDLVFEVGRYAKLSSLLTYLMGPGKLSGWPICLKGVHRGICYARHDHLIV